MFDGIIVEMPIIKTTVALVVGVILTSMIRKDHSRLGTFLFSKMGENIRPYIKTLTVMGVWIILIDLIVGFWGISLNTILTSLGITGVVFAFASRDTFASLFSGVVLLIEKPFEVGDTISHDKIRGVVLEINLRSIKVQSEDGQVFVIPNSKVSTDTFINHSISSVKQVMFYLAVKHDTSSWDKLQRKTTSFQEMEPHFCCETSMIGVRGEQEIYRLVIKTNDLSDEEAVRLRESFKRHLLTSYKMFGDELCWMSDEYERLWTK